MPTPQEARALMKQLQASHIKATVARIDAGEKGKFCGLHEARPGLQRKALCAQACGRIWYTTLDEIGIDPDTLRFKPMPAPSTNNADGPLTIAEAKQRLAKHFSVAPENIETSKSLFAAEPSALDPSPADPARAALDVDHMAHVGTGDLHALVVAPTVVIPRGADVSIA